MDEHEDHEAKADDVERSLGEMHERSGRLEDEIEATGEDWERKQGDPAVPGAVGRADDDDSGDGGEELDFGRDVDYEAIADPGDTPRAGD